MMRTVCHEYGAFWALSPLLWVLSGMVMVAGAACGGSQTAPRAASGAAPRTVHRAEEPVEAPSAAPVEISAQATRVGDSVRVDITAVGRRRREGHPMEDPKSWNIAAKSGQVLLKRVVNGSVQVMRHPVGYTNLWDIRVRFSVAFAVPRGATDMDIAIRAPESELFETTLSIAGAGLGPAEP